MNVELQNICINRPVVKINTELKVIERTSPAPEFVFDGAGYAIPYLINQAIAGIFGNATIVPEE